MSIYDVINSILFKRPIDRSAVEEMHGTFMFNRWFSFYDPSVIPLANELNRVAHQFQDKQVSYSFLNTVVPKLKYKRIPYIKKGAKPRKKKADEEREKKIEMLAKRWEISQREAKEYVDLLETVA